MKRIIVLILMVLLLGGGQVLADFYDGLRAYDAKDYATALREWEGAAKTGDAKAQFHLAQLYEEGLGAPQNFIHAHLYYNLAAAQGHEKARTARNALTEQMDKSELAEARKLAAAWKPEPVRPLAARPQTDSGQGATASSQAPLAPEQLWEAAAKGDTSLVTHLVEAGMDVNAADQQGWTALHVASAEGKTEVVEQLLEAGADVNTITSDGALPVWIALLGRHHQVLEVLLKNGAELTRKDPAGNSLLLVAVEQKDLQLTNMLLKGGANPNDPNAEGIVPLMAATATGQTVLIEQLVEFGAHVNAVNGEGATALMLAVGNAHSESVEKLIQVGAKLDTKTSDGLTALDVANGKGQKEIITLLLKHTPGHLVQAVALESSELVRAQLALDADPNMKDKDGRPVLMLAAAIGNEEIVAQLLEAKADVNATNADGTTALMAATLGNHLQVVKKLLAVGADVKRKNQAGATVWDIAKTRGVEQMLALFPQPRLTEISKLADAGDHDAQFQVGKLYLEMGGRKNAKKAARYLMKAAEARHPQAAGLLGDLYWDGRGVQHNLEEAERWYSLGAYRGDQHSQQQLPQIEQALSPSREIQAEKDRQKRIDQKNEFLKLVREKRYEEAFRKAEILHDVLDDPDVELFLGEVWEKGLAGKNKYWPLAEIYYQRAADYGSQEAKRRLENHEAENYW